jgi:hypothetical protein
MFSLMICLKNFNSKNVIFSNYCWLQYIIAFTYRQNGAIVGCKYRTMEKRFWQVNMLSLPCILKLTCSGDVLASSRWS